jgi:DNA-binding NarL/FixJ family response regulator
VLICDDHPLMSQGLKALLRPSFLAVGVVNDGRELIPALESTRPDVVLLDLSMPHVNGLELIPRITERAPHVKVLVVTMHIDRALAELAISSGAHGFIPKESSAEELNSAIEAVLTEDKPFVSPRVPRRSFSGDAGTGHPAFDRLTPRHRQIMRLIADGRSTQEIADELGVSPRTVEFHRARIRRALGITTEWGLMRFAIMMRVSEGHENGATGDEPTDLDDDQTAQTQTADGRRQSADGN